MLRYRVLLVDTEASTKPLQSLCIDVPAVDKWARKTLAKAGKHAYVVVYRVTEVEIGTLKKGDYRQGKDAANFGRPVKEKRKQPDDEGSISDLQPPGPQASEQTG